jgi:peptidyl-prolyl cis-trans isomerase D
MIKLIHKYNKSIAIVFLFVAACFAISGVGIDILHDGGNVQRSAITVNDKRFSDREFQRAEANTEERYRKMFGDKYAEYRDMFGLNISQQTIDQLIDSTLLNQEASRLGFAGDDDTVRKYILEKIFAQTPYDEGRFRALLQTAGLTFKEFSSEIKNEASRDALVSLLRDAAYVSNKDVQARIIRQETSFNVVAAEIKTSDIAATVPAPSDELLRGYYNSHASSFEVPAKVSYGYIDLSPAAFEKDVPVTQQDVEVYYSEHQPEFTTPEQVRVSEITVLYPKSSDPKLMADTKVKAKTAHEEASTGQPFKDLVGKYSDDTPRKATGGDRGWIERGREAPQFEKVVFATAPGAIAELIETDSGFKIVKVEEKKASSLKPIDAVRAEIEGEIRKAEAPSYAAAKAQELLKIARRDGKSLLEVSGAFGYPVKESKGLSAEGTDPSPEISGLTAKVLQLPTSDRLALSLVESGDSSVLVQVKEFKDASIAPFDEVRAKVTELVKAQEAQKLAEQKAQAVLTAGQAAPANLAAEAQKLGVQVIGPAQLSRADSMVAALPDLTPQISSAIFSTKTAPSIVGRYFPTRNGFIVIAVTGITRPEASKAKTDKELEQYRSEAESEYSQRSLESALLLLKTSATIEVDPALQTRQ